MQNASRWLGSLASLLTLFAFSGCYELEEDTLGACADDAYVVGNAGQFSVQELSFEWDLELKDMVARTQMLRFALPTDLVGAVFTLNDPGATPVFYDAFLDNRLMTTATDDPGETPLSKSIGGWPNSVSLGLPSNAKTMPSNGRCLELDVVSLGGNFEEGGTLTVSSVRRTGRQLGNTFDVQVRVLDDAISNGELQALAPELRQIFASSGHNAPLPKLMDSGLSWTSTSGTGVILVDDEMAPGGDYYQLASAEFEGLERGVNVVFVSELLLDSFDDDLTLLGLAGGIPATPFDGTGASSLFISVESHLDGAGNLLVDLMAATIAHELGHMLGLFHLSEQAGTDFDPIADTPQCTASRYDTNEDGMITARECASGGGGDNLMFWEADILSPNRLSPEQIAVLRSHPLMFLEAE